jgi:signal transduction histidine kinase
LLPWLAVNNPQTGQPRLPLVFDPETGRITPLAWTSLERIVLSSRVFKFRVDLPAWIVIGSFPLFGLLVGLVLSLGMSRSITRPVSELAEAAHAIGRRELGYRVRSGGSQELQDLARSFNRMAEQLDHAEITRRNLMADVAHELRTPLAVLDGNLRALLDGVHAMSEEEIALLYEQTRHLTRLVDDLRDLSLAEADRLSLDCQEVDLVRLVKETVAHFGLVAQEQGIQLIPELDEPLIHPCLDENRIRQVLHNLLSNAFRHTPRGGRVGISAKFSPDNNAHEIKVTDNGSGISPEELPHIFDRFYRAEAKASDDHSGTGLGLAIVKAIVEAQKGAIRVESPGRQQGSTFTVTFPIPASGSVSDDFSPNR